MIAMYIKSRLGFIGSYSPRKCGVAIFDTGLIRNLGPAGGREVCVPRRYIRLQRNVQQVRVSRIE
jgi:hypothetical protein